MAAVVLAPRKLSVEQSDVDVGHLLLEEHRGRSGRNLAARPEWAAARSDLRQQLLAAELRQRDAAKNLLAAPDRNAAQPGVMTIPGRARRRIGQGDVVRKLPEGAPSFWRR